MFELPKPLIDSLNSVDKYNLLLLFLFLEIFKTVV
jgi:hypothetical protein